MTPKAKDYYELDNNSENRDEAETPDQIFQKYTAAVVIFTQRFLTQQGDILDAFQGIMNHFGRLMGDGFIYGLPLAAFDAVLLWKDEGDWMGDLTDQWNPTVTEYGTTYAHHVERREWRERALKARLGNGRVRNSVVDCDKFPTWSWCGWKGLVSYYHDNGAVSELKGEITWPWKPEYTSPPNESISMQRKSVLQVEAWIASVDLAVLRSFKIPDTFWGWPTENGQRVRNGVFECLLLSTGIDREFRGFGIELVPQPFCNIMILGSNGSGGAVYRRGIAQMYIEDWEMFGPHIKLPGTGSLCETYLTASIWLGGREGGTSFGSTLRSISTDTGKTQYLRCVGDERQSYEEQTSAYCRMAVMNNRFDREHLKETKELERNHLIMYDYLKCKEEVKELKHLDLFRIILGLKC